MANSAHSARSTRGAASTNDVRAERASETPDNAQRAVQSVEVGGRLLLVLAAHPEPMSLKDLAAEADLPPARAHPYLVSFGKLGLVEQNRDSGRYALGPAALQLGLTCLHQLEPMRAASPVAAQLAESTGYAVALAVWGNFGPTIVSLIEARQPLLVTMRAGTVMSVFRTATGRAFAAALPDSRLAQAMSGAVGDEPRPASRFSREEAEIVRQARDDVRRHGVVRAEGRPIPSVNAFSAPAFDHEGRPVLVLTALGHQDDFATEWNSPAAEAVRKAAAEISSRLGWRARPDRKASGPAA
jgi:DNA-binding IclR family transcriptional regulator